VSPRQVTVCKPSADHLERYNEVLREIRLRRKAIHDKKELDARKEFDKRKAMSDAQKASSLEHGGEGVQVFGRPSAGECSNQLLKVIVKNGLKLDLVECKELRKFAGMCARAGNGLLLSSKHQGVDIPMRKKFTEVLLPAFDDELNERIASRIRPMIVKNGVTIMGDGFTSTSSRPILNTIAGTVVGDLLLEAMDTSGITKNMEFIASTTIRHIEAIGPENVVAATFDGACRGAFALIIAKYPHVQVFIDSSHTWDGWMKAMGSNKPRITMASCGYKNVAEQVPFSKLQPLVTPKALDVKPQP
jgi:Protein of unknown function (DUF 659)